MNYKTSILLPLLATATHAITIDSFNEELFGVSATTAGSQTQESTGISTSETIGGVREITLNTGGTPSAFARNDFSNQAPVGQATWAVAPSVTGNFNLSYGNFATSGSDLNADFSTEEAIEVRVISTDLAGEITVSLSVNSGAAVYAGTLNVPASVGTGGPASPALISVDFSDFTLESGSGSLNLADVDGVSFQSQNLANADWQLDFIQTRAIPEPSSMLLISFVGFGCLLRRSRKA